MNFLLFKCAIVARTPLPPKKSATISLGLELAKIIRSINGYGFSVAYSTLLSPSTGYLEATANYPGDLVKIINDSGHTKQQIFQCI